MEQILVVGGGVIGPVIALFLAGQGYKVDIYEREPSPRDRATRGGRSINLTLCKRGFDSLARVGALDRVRDLCIPARGRIIHATDSTISYQPYGNPGEAIYSVSRGRLIVELLDLAAHHPRITLHYNQECSGIALDPLSVTFRHRLTNELTQVAPDRAVAADGANSILRTHLAHAHGFAASHTLIPQEYRELTIPPDAAGGWRLDKHAVHIWPRGRYMLIGFANLDGSFTAALHMPTEGEHAFATIQNEADLRSLFAHAFPDALSLIPGLVEEFFHRPSGKMGTVRCSRWVVNSQVVLIGDSAHAIVPSYGQGANCGLEDCSVLNDCLRAAGGDWPAALERYEQQRKVDTDVIADLALAHFEELQVLVGSPEFLAHKEIERRLHQLYPAQYIPLYSMISFTNLPYSEAQRRDREQQRLAQKVFELVRERPADLDKVLMPELLAQLSDAPTASPADEKP